MNEYLLVTLIHVFRYLGLLFPFSLELCPECREGLLCQQQRDLREYTQATIYVHKVVDNKKVPVPLVALAGNGQARVFHLLLGVSPRTAEDHIFISMEFLV